MMQLHAFIRSWEAIQSFIVYAFEQISSKIELYKKENRKKKINKLKKQQQQQNEERKREIQKVKKHINIQWLRLK